jgi:DNA-binding NarL/FixJ family response regulator
MNLRHCGLNRATAQASGRPLRDQQSDAHHIHIPLRWSSFGRAAFRNRFGRRAPRCSRSVQFFAEERPMKEIAAVLTLSQKTVEFHKHHMMLAFNLKGSADWSYSS